MLGPGYWIDPDGEVKRLPGGRHIDQMIANPERFGLTREEIIERYREEGEPVGLEGRARERLIVEAVERGFIHIRLDLRRGWTVTVSDEGPNVSAALCDWAEEAAREAWAGPDTRVRLQLLRTGQIRITSVRALLSPPSEYEEV